MPAVRTFSFFAGAAVFINFMLQVCINNSVIFVLLTLHRYR